jgi:glycosyltransferase involved in cell wall biosynthesis
MCVEREMRSKRVLVYPFVSDGNKYTELMHTALRTAGITPCPMHPRFLLGARFVWLNWFENLDQKSPFPQTQADQKIIKLRQIIKGRKIIWTLHNRQPHCIQYDVKNMEAYSLASYQIMHLLTNTACRIVVHARDNYDIIKEIGCDLKEILPKLFFIPHPAYIGIYGKQRIDIMPADTTLRLLFLGRIAPYKKIDLLIDAINELSLDNVALKICGFPSDESYAAYLRGKAGNNTSISIDFRHIPNDEIATLLAENHIIVLPYDKSSSHNSGTAMLAFSYGRTVLTPYGGTLDNFKDRSIFFSYVYNNDKDHYLLLKDQIAKIHSAYINSYNDILKLGDRCKTHISHYNNLNVVSNAIKNMFTDIEFSSNNNLSSNMYK